MKAPLVATSLAVLLILSTELPGNHGEASARSSFTHPAVTAESPLSHWSYMSGKAGKVTQREEAHVHVMAG